MRVQSVTRDLSAVILAGGLSDSGSPWALVPINGRPMVNYVIDAFKGCGIEDIILVAPWTEGLDNYYGCRVVTGADSLIGNIEAGLRAALHKHVIISACDIPGLTTEAVDSFISACLNNPSRQCDVFVSIALVCNCDREFPGMKRTSLRLREGRVTLGNVFLVHNKKMLSRLKKIGPLVKGRKSIFALAWRFGLGNILRFAGTRLLRKMNLDVALFTIGGLERTASKLLGIPVKAVFVAACIASDVDNEEQLDAYKALL